MLNFIRGVVRPVVTFGLVAAFIAAAFLNMEAAQIIAGPAGLVLGWWFQERSKSRTSSG